MKDTLKYSHPLCFSVAYCEAKQFMYQAFMVKEDSTFIIGLVTKNDKKTLDYMEAFYRTIKKEERLCQKDVYSRIGHQLLPLSAIGELGSELNDKMKEFEEIKIKKL